MNATRLSTFQPQRLVPFSGRATIGRIRVKPLVFGDGIAMGDGRWWRCCGTVALRRQRSPYPALGVCAVGGWLVRCPVYVARN
eukprot:scaffold40155_cov28-Tisochrysis_lutea.AAC.1